MLDLVTGMGGIEHATGRPGLMGVGGTALNAQGEVSVGPVEFDPMTANLDTYGRPDVLRYHYQQYRDAMRYFLENPDAVKALHPVEQQLVRRAMASRQRLSDLEAMLPTPEQRRRSLPHRTRDAARHPRRRTCSAEVILPSRPDRSSH